MVKIKSEHSIQTRLTPGLVTGTVAVKLDDNRGVVGLATVAGVKPSG